MAKKLKKKVHIHWKAIIVFLLFATFCYVSFNQFASLPIKNIYVSGNSLLTDQEVIEIAGIENYPSFYWTSSKSMKRKLVGNPYIESVSISKKWFNQLHIKVNEYRPLFRKSSNQMIVLENKEELSGDFEVLNLPTLINYVADTKYDSFVQSMGKVKLDVLYQISEIQYDPNEQDKDRFLLYMDDGNVVYLTLTKFKQINYYDEVIPQLDGKKGILYLDSGNHFQIME